MLTIKQLRTVVSASEALDDILEDLESLGFPATSWQDGSVARTIVEIRAQHEAIQSEWAKLIVEQGFNELAIGDGLTQFARSHYDNIRQPALPTQGLIFLSSSAALPFNYDIGDIIVADDNFSYTYRNTISGTLNAASSSYVPFEAEVSASNRNVGNNTISTFVQGFAGVTCSNPPDATTGTWITQNGTDEESDDALKSRNRTKWATLPYATPAAGYVNIAKGATSEVTRAAVDSGNPRGQGTANVYIWSSGSSAPSSGSRTAVLAAINARKPIESNVDVLAALPRGINVTATLTINAGATESVVRAAVTAAITDFINSVPLGGKRVGGTGMIIWSALIAAIKNVTDVVTVDLRTPATDVTLDVFDVAIPGTITLTINSNPFMTFESG